MLILALVVVAALLTRFEWVRRQRERQRHLIAGWLRERDVRVDGVTIGFSHGWPYYQVAFPAAEEGERFRHSPRFHEFLEFIASLNASGGRFGRAFDPRLAVVIMPPPSSRAQMGAA